MVRAHGPQRLEDRGVLARGQGREQVGDAVGQAGGESHTNKRGTQAHTNLAEEVVVAGSGSKQGWADVVLHRHDEQLEEHTHAQTEDEGITHNAPHWRVLVEGGHQHHATRRDNRANDDEDTVPTDARGKQTSHRRGQQNPDRHGDEQQARHGSRVAIGHLHIGRQVSKHTEHRTHGQHADNRRDDESAIAEELERQHRILDATLHKGQQTPCYDRDDAQTDDLPRQPVVLGTAPGGEQHDRHGAGVHESQSKPVDLRRQFVLGKFKSKEAGDPGHHAKWQVDPEHPAPGDRVGEPAAQKRPKHRGDAEHRTHRRHVSSADARRDEVSGNRLGQDHKATTTQALNEAVENERDHGAGGTTEGRPQQK